ENFFVQIRQTGLRGDIDRYTDILYYLQYEYSERQSMLAYIQYYNVRSCSVEQLFEQFDPAKYTFVDAASIHMLLVRINITNQLSASGVIWTWIIDRSRIYRTLA